MSTWRVAPSPDTDLAKALVVAFDYTRPDENYTAIGEDLAARSIRGAIMFDLLLCNGAGNHRFFVINFDGQKFDLKNVRRVSVPSGPVLTATTALLKAHHKELALGILSREQQLAVRGGQPL